MIDNLSDEQKEFLKRRLIKFTTIKEVEKFYDQNSKLDDFARQTAKQIFLK